MFTQHIGATGQYDLSTGDESFISCVEFTVYGFTGSMIPQTKQATDGPGPFVPNYFNCAYVNADTGVSYSAGTAITADGRYIADTTGAYLSLIVGNAGDGDFWVVGKPFMGPAPSFSSGSGGGGAVTIADGADVTLGTIADAVVQGDVTGTVNAHLRGANKALGAIADAAVTNPASSASVIAALKGVLTGVNAATPAGTNTIGKVGGLTGDITPTLAVTASAYAAGNCMGGKLTLTSAMASSGGTGAWSSLTITDHGNQKPLLDVLLFGSNPAGAFTDHAAFPTMSVADNALVLHRISIITTDWVTIGGSAYATIKVGGLPVTATGSANLYAAMNVTSGTPTPGATTDLNAVFGFFRDQ